MSNRLRCSLIFTLLLAICLPLTAAAQPRDKGDYLLLLKEGAKAKGTILGNIGVHDPFGTLKIGRSAVLGVDTIGVADRLFISANAQVADIFANTLRFDPDKAIISGTLTQPVPAPIFVSEGLILPGFPPPTPTFCGGLNRFGEVGGAFALTPGKYGTIRINRGGLATMTPGTYDICDLKVDRDAALKITGPVTINIRDKFQVKNGATLVPIGTQSADDVVINFSGKKAVRFGQKATVSATLSAPLAALRLGRRSVVTGHFVAKSLKSDRGFVAALPLPPPVCGNQIVDVGESCDPPGTAQPPSGNICRVDCTYCGDGVLQAGEECDDGNNDNNDACRTTCTLPPPAPCGNGSLDPGETCDPPGADPPPAGGNLCRTTCTYCGDGAVNGNEQCDDGNTNDGDACTNDCTLPPGPTCGNGALESGETCDPPGSDPPPAGGNLCRTDCSYCGDTVVDAGEECDDGNTVDNDSCRNDCTLPPPDPCGNGSVDAGETCDPPGSDPPPAGGNLCRLNCSYCGDTVVDTGEECDDGNATNNDGCANDCTISQAPTCGNFVIDVGETCEPPGSDPAPPGGNLCRVDCTYCGDGTIDGIEECDDGNDNDTDGCRNDCTLPPPTPICGDGALNQPGETCDPPGSDPAPIPGNLCRGDCTSCGDGTVDPGEECDDANAVDADLCRNDCTFPPPTPCGLVVTKTCVVEEPPSSGGECTGGAVSMTFRYTGESCAATNNQQSGSVECSGDPAGAAPIRVVMTADASDATVTPSSETIGIGDQVTIAATGAKLRSNIEFALRQGGATRQSLRIHTSCSKPLAVGDQFGAMLLVSLTSKNGGTQTLPEPPAPTSICEVTATPPPPHCLGKVLALSLRYTGGDCTLSNSQVGKALCLGGTTTAEPVRIVITRDEDKVSASPSTESVNLGDTVVITSSDDELNSDTEFDIRQGGSTLQSLKIHTSCSKALNVGDRFGALEVTAIDSTEGGLITTGANVEYFYELTNDGPGTVTNIAVTDDLLGTVPGSPVASLGVGASVTLSAMGFVDTDTTNVVTAAGQVGGSACEALDSATVSVVDPPEPPAACASGLKVGSLTLRYTGEGCSAGNNPQEGKATCTRGANFAESVRIEIRDDKAGTTRYGDEADLDIGDAVVGTAADASRDAFKSQTLVRIFNSEGALIEEDSFHTSCSKALAVGDTFGSVEVIALGLVSK